MKETGLPALGHRIHLNAAARGSRASPPSDVVADCLDRVPIPSARSRSDSPAEHDSTSECQPWPLRTAYSFFRALPLASLVLCVILLRPSFVAFSTGFWLPFRLAYVILLALPLCFLWARLSLWGVHAEIGARDRPAAAGAGAGANACPSRTGAGFEAVAGGRRAVGPAGARDPPRRLPRGRRQRRSWKAVSTCGRRGLYTLGSRDRDQRRPVRPLPLHEVLRPAADRPGLPAPVELAAFACRRRSCSARGRCTDRRTTSRRTPSASGSTPSATATTASTGRARPARSELMVKLFEMDPASNVWIVHGPGERRPRPASGEQVDRGIRDNARGFRLPTISAAPAACSG